MKSLFETLLIVLVALSLTACNKDSSKINIISAAELNEREQAILSTTANKSVIFDFDQDKEYKKVSVWIEKYETGKLVDDKVSYILSEIDQSGSIIFAASQNREKEETEEFHIGITSHSGSDSVSVSDTISTDYDLKANLWDHLEKESIEEDGKVLLASICYTKDENGILSPINYFEDAKALLNELKQYDVAYLLKAEFSK